MNETQTDRIIQSAARHSRASNSELWIAAYQAHKVYGLYQEHATNEIAQQAGRTRSAVKNWVNAYRCFVSMLAVNYQLTLHYRRILTLTHFSAMYELMQKYNLAGHHALYYFGIMSNYRLVGQSWSVDALRQEVEADKNWKQAVDWRWYAKRLDNIIVNILSFNGQIPDKLRDWAREYQEIGGEWE